MTSLRDELRAAPLGHATGYPDTYDAALLFRGAARAAARGDRHRRRAAVHRRATSGRRTSSTWLDDARQAGRSRSRRSTCPRHRRRSSSRSRSSSISGRSRSRGSPVPDDVPRRSRAISRPPSARRCAVTLIAPSAFAQQRIAELPGESLDRPVHGDRPLRGRPVAAARPTDPWSPRRCAPISFVRSARSPDSPTIASIAIAYRGPRIDRAGLLRYLVSYRCHAGFHEHCVERIFVDVMAALPLRDADGLRALHAPRRPRHQSVSHQRRRAGAGQRAHGAAVSFWPFARALTCVGKASALRDDRVGRKPDLQGRVATRRYGRMAVPLSPSPTPVSALTIALSKGRILDETLPLFAPRASSRPKIRTRRAS